MIARIPWLEGASVAAGLTALAAFAHAREATASSLLTAALAALAPWAARAVARRGQRAEGARGLPSLLIGAASLAASTMTLNTRAPDGFVTLRALALALVMAAFVALQARRSAAPGAWIAATLAALATFAGMLAGPSLRAALVSSTALAVTLLGGFRLLRAGTPDERARRTLELSAALVAVAILVLSGRDRAPMISGPLAAVAAFVLAIGVSAAHARVAYEEAPRVARASVALLAGVFAALSMSAADDPPLFAPALAAVVTIGVDRAGLALLRALPSSRLAAAARAATASLAGQESVEDVARAALEPLRDPADVRVTGELWIIDAARRATLDIAGTVRWHGLALDAERALLSWLRSRPEEVAYADALRDRSAERAEAPAVLASLHAKDAFCAVGGFTGGALSCVLIVPRAGRDEPPEWDEREALRVLGRRLAAALESAEALEVARRRAAEAERIAREAEASRSEAVARCEIAEGRVARAPNVVRLAGTLETAWVGYSAPMRALDQRLRAVAQRRSALGIVCSGGGPREAVLWRLHGYAPWSGAPCVALDASRVHPRDAVATLFGTESSLEGEARVEAQAGALELAGEGTLGLFDAQALGHEALSALAVALREGVASRVRRGSMTRPEDAAQAAHREAHAYPVKARVVLFLRDAPITSGLPAELCEALGEDALSVPSLAARSEDLEARVLLAIDRACRVLGREPMGIGREALEALRVWPFPGDDRELDEVIERAALVASGRITVEDLPSPVGRPRSAASVRPSGLVDAETFDALERRILEAALERSNGNKSEAARALGLARTTFLDKLRKHGLRA